MARLVFDIETSALPVDFFDAVQPEYLFRDCGETEDETARTERRSESPPAESLAFDAQVVCIANAQRRHLPRQVLFTAEDSGRLPANLAPLNSFPAWMKRNFYRLLGRRPNITTASSL